MVGLTLITNVLLCNLRLGAGNSLSIRLPLEGRAPVAGALGVHGLLEGIPLPAKQVIAVNTIAGVVTMAPVEGLRPVGGPLGLVIELARVIHDLVHDLGDLDGMGRRAGAAALKGTRGRVRDVRLVVWAVDVLAVPARREGHGHAPAAAAGRLGEGLGVGARAGCAAERALLHVGLAPEAQPGRDLAGLPVGWVTDEHAETLSWFTY